MLSAPFRLFLLAGLLSVTGCALRFDTVPVDEQVFRDSDDHPETQEAAFQRVAEWASSKSGYFQTSLVEADSVSGTIIISGVHFINRQKTPKGVRYRLTTVVRNEFARFEYVVQDFVQPTIDRISRDDMLELEEQYDLLKLEILLVIAEDENH